MWAIGRYSLHLTEREFWRLTWRQFAALMRRYDLERQHDDYRAAIIACEIFNAAGYIDKDSKESVAPRTPNDYFSSLPKPKRRRKDPSKAAYSALMALSGTKKGS